MEKESKDIFFVEVREPVAVRRSILESLKEIVENLQRFEKFKISRQKRVKKIENLRAIIKDAYKLGSSIKSSLPDIKIGAVKTFVVKKEKKKNVPVRIEEKKQVSELQKLEEELNTIEKRLKGLS